MNRDKQVMLFLAVVIFVQLVADLWRVHDLNALRAEAIERGYAVHDSHTGEWRWVERGEASK